MSAQRFRKKPVEVEAIRFDGSRGAAVAINKWAGESWHHTATNCLAIPTLEGEMLAIPGDWIIRGVKGEFYPCKPDIFDATYESAEAAA